MGLTYSQIKDKPRKLRALTGLTRSEFTDLLAAFNTVSRRNYARQNGGRRKTCLDSNEDQLLFILVYLKTYPLREITGELFGMELSKVNEWTHRLLPVVCDALDEFGAMPERDAKTSKREGRKQRMERAVPLDDTDRHLEHSKTSKKQTEHDHHEMKGYRCKMQIGSAHVFWSN